MWSSLRSLFSCLLLLSLFSPWPANADRLWSSGAELNSATANVEINSITGTGSTIVTSPVRSGTYAYDFTKGGSAAATFTEKIIRSGVDASDTCIRAYVHVTTSVSTLIPIMRILDAAGNVKTSIRMNTDNTLELWDDVTPAQVGSDSSALSATTWYRIELCSTYTLGTTTAYIDNTSFATGTVSAITTNGQLRFGMVTSATGSLQFDDLAINSSDGSSQTGLPGAGSIVHLRPNAVGDNAMGSRGGSDSGTAWGQLSEVTPDDATAYYILEDADDIVDVNITATSGIIDSPTSITLVQVGIREAAASAAANGWNLRIESQASGTVVNGTTTTHDDTTYKTNGDALPRNYTLTSYVDPQAGGAWTTSLLDSTQIGVKCTDAAPDCRISTLWALVEFVPGSPTPTPTPTLTPTATATATATNTPAAGVIKDVIMVGAPIPRPR